MRGVFAIGKYDLQKQTAQPYLGVVSACQEIVRKIVDDGNASPDASPETLDSIRADLLNDLGHEGLNLLHLPVVVMALDDVQWVDTASIELVSDLLADIEVANLMIVFLYRPDDNDSTSLVAKLNNELRDKESKKILKLMKVEVGRLSENDVNSIILDLLSMDTCSATMDLAALCCRRTGGNVFFLLAFLRMLKDKGYLKYNFGMLKWTWKLEEIESETVATSNVIHSRRKDLDVLKFEKVSIEDFLAVAQEEGILELLTGRNPLRYRWTHDSIQEAAESLIPANESLKLKYDVGKQLLSGLSESEIGNYIFVILGLLNPFALNANTLSLDERIQLAGLNYLAAIRSSKLSSISSTSKFVKCGIAFLPEGHWHSHTVLSLGLFTIATEVKGAQMHEHAMNLYASEVLSQDHLTVLDTLRVYRAQIQYWGLSNNEKSVELCLAALSQLGCRFPRSSFFQTVSLIFCLLKHKRELKKRTIQEVSNLQAVTSI
ncbi:PAS sensor protein [Nitzschia inconspicua]|uniref:PAS sensor protein n=1 Tax=Nitzschia inconspicua TaxID=303405 RepID=A0A9K3KBR5_9STRA|nr:PAS sensor protein [Nitzschia inconspicua]